jgi:hypothetical protein
VKLRAGEHTDPVIHSEPPELRIQPPLLPSPRLYVTGVLPSPSVRPSTSITTARCIIADYVESLREPIRKLRGPAH